MPRLFDLRSNGRQLAFPNELRRTPDMTYTEQE
jgi:hypothetical protein